MYDIFDKKPNSCTLITALEKDQSINVPSDWLTRTSLLQKMRWTSPRWSSHRPRDAIAMDPPQKWPWISCRPARSLLQVSSWAMNISKNRETNPFHFFKNSMRPGRRNWSVPKRFVCSARLSLPRWVWPSRRMASQLAYSRRKRHHIWLIWTRIPIYPNVCCTTSRMASLVWAHTRPMCRKIFNCQDRTSWRSIAPSRIETARSPCCLTRMPSSL